MHGILQEEWAQIATHTSSCLAVDKLSLLPGWLLRLSLCLATAGFRLGSVITAYLYLIHDLYSLKSSTIVAEFI